MQLQQQVLMVRQGQQHLRSLCHHVLLLQQLHSNGLLQQLHSNGLLQLLLVTVKINQQHHRSQPMQQMPAVRLAVYQLQLQLAAAASWVLILQSRPTALSATTKWKQLQQCCPAGTSFAAAVQMH
jgi:hypothetical protein